MKTQKNINRINETSKKAYVTPSMRVIKLGTVRMLAESNIPFGQPGPFD